MCIRIVDAHGGPGSLYSGVLILARRQRHMCRAAVRGEQQGGCNGMRMTEIRLRTGVIDYRIHKFYEVIMSEVGSDFFFFFQAEDGIRDLTVTGVQTCALPISGPGWRGPGTPARTASRCSAARRTPRPSGTRWLRVALGPAWSRPAWPPAIRSGLDRKSVV